MSRLLFGLLALVLIASSLVAADNTPVERKTNDRQIIDLLAAVHDNGKELFNAGDHAGCFRLFQGSLSTVKLVLPKEMHEAIDRGFSRAVQEPDFARRALVLHEVIEDVRKKLHPTAGSIEKLGPPRKATTGSDAELKAPPVVDPPKIPSNVAETVEPPKAPPAAPKTEPAPPPVLQITPTTNPKPAKPMPPPDALTSPDALNVPPRPATPMAAPPSPLPAPVTPAGLPELAPLPPPMAPPPPKTGGGTNAPPPLTAPGK
jgi:hypothetical protein